MLAKELRDVSEHHVWRFLRAQRIGLAGRKSWYLSADPELVAKAAAIVGLDLNPPENAIVLAVDACPVRAGLGPRSPTRPGKPAIQALERAQGYLRLPNGRSLRPGARMPAARQQHPAHRARRRDRPDQRPCTPSGAGGSSSSPS